MPYLGDYIGHLLSEITIARMHADLEAVRVAELYASHPLLRHMPVPRFRLPEIDMVVPVVIKQVEDPQPESSPRGGAPLATLRRTFGRVLEDLLIEQGIKLTVRHLSKLRATLDARVAPLAQPNEVAVDTNRVADVLALESVRMVREMLSKRSQPDLARIQELEGKLKANTRVAFLKLRTPPPRLSILATSAEVREAGPNEIVTRINLKISEQAIEWTSIDSEGTAQDRLIPE